VTLSASESGSSTSCFEITSSIAMNPELFGGSACSVSCFTSLLWEALLHTPTFNQTAALGKPDSA
jgi:hypothetical protein